MKTIIFSAVMALLLIFAQSTFATQFRPISEITEFEKEIIGNATKKPADRILKDAVKFKVNRNLVILKFLNGDEGYYGFETRNTNTNTDNNKLEEYFDNQQKPPDKEKTDYEDNYAQELWGDFISTYLDCCLSRNETIDEEKLTEANNFMKVFHDYLISDPLLIRKRIEKIQPNVNIVLGNRGNQYYYVFETIQNHLTPMELLDFYDLYLLSGITPNRYKPNDYEKESAIHMIKLIILNYMAQDEVIGLVSSDEFKRLNPQGYEELKRSGKIH